MTETIRVRADRRLRTCSSNRRWPRPLWSASANDPGAGEQLDSAEPSEEELAMSRELVRSGPFPGVDMTVRDAQCVDQDGVLRT